jgi:hypothetical protein
MELKLSERVVLAVAARAIRLLPPHLQQARNADDMLYMLHGERIGREPYILQQAHRMVLGLVEWSAPWYPSIDSPNIDKDVLADCEKCVDDAMALPIGRGLVAANPANENEKIATPPAQVRAKARQVKRGNPKR